MATIVRRRRAGVLGAAVGAGVLVSLAGVAWAQETRANPRGAPLGGPRVDGVEVPGAGRFSGERRAERDRVSPAEFQKAVLSVIGEEAPAGTRATPEQMAKITALKDDFERRMREFQRSHREEMAQLRATAGEGDGKARRGGDEPMMSDVPDAERQAARERLRVLREQMPQVAALQKDVWVLLSEAQRAGVQAELDRIASARIAERERGRAERKLADRESERTGVIPPAQGGEAGAARRERLLKMWDRLTPEQQQRVLERLAREAGQESGPGGRAEGSKRRGSKPAGGEDDAPKPDER